MSKVAFLDGDGFLYTIAASMEKTKFGVSWTSPNSLLTFGTSADIKQARTLMEERQGQLWQRKEVGTLSEAIARLRTAVNEAMITTGCSELGFIVSGTRNFRDQIGTIRRYKGNRDATARPALLDELRAWAEETYDGYMITDNMEPDDLISILARSDKGEPDSDVVMVSCDKDFKQIPGYHYNWRTKVRDFISEDQALKNLYVQILQGDPGDNIVGCWGVGPTKAEAFVSGWLENHYTELDIWSSIVQQFEMSKKREGCPYEREDAEEVATEMYLLVHLLEYAQEGEDILATKYKSWEPKNNQKIRNKAAIRKVNGHKEETSPDQSTSECARTATEADIGVCGPCVQPATG